METSEELVIRKRLEWELSLSWTDIRSLSWFHGSITRSEAEKLLVSCGQFLVRNCSSRPDDYVLSTRSSDHVLHFVISRVVSQANTDYQTIRYTFEDDYFDSISDLITFYVGNKRPISLASMAVITTPVNRTVPLTDLQFYTDKTNNNLIEMKYNCEPNESDSSEDNTSSPPPKPSRIPMETNHSFEHIHTLPTVTDQQKLSNISLNCDNLSESSGHSSGKTEDSAFFSENVSPKQTEDTNYETRNTIQIPQTIDSTIDLLSDLTISEEPIYSSIIKAQTFHTYLLPKENKPLESTAIVKIQSVLSDTGPRILANHLAKCDIQFINLLDIEHPFGPGIGSALELILVPFGHQMRLDLIERHECLKYFVVITILTAISEQNRTIITNKWIEIAIETKTALGDLFGFAAIMEALEMPAIAKLNSWNLVRKDFTKNAISYETKLRPQFKSMTECTEPHAPNTSFPFILTLIQILERHSIYSEKENSTNDRVVAKHSESLNLWFEQKAVDCGLQHIYSHLEFGSQMYQQMANYRRNAQMVLNGDIQFEELLSDMFRTEFHRQFLFGIRGSQVDSDEKFHKFDRIVMALVRKCQPDVQF